MKFSAQEEAAYIAGLFDGERCVNFARSRNSAYIRVMVVNTNKDVLLYLQSHFGGDISPLSHKKDGWRQGWSWRLSWTKAVDFLDVIYPYLRIKAQQADVAFAWNATRLGRGGKSSREHVEAMEFLIKELTFLNKKGIHNEQDPLDLLTEEINDAA